MRKILFFITFLLSSLYSVSQNWTTAYNQGVQYFRDHSMFMSFHVVNHDTVGQFSRFTFDAVLFKNYWNKQQEYCSIYNHTSRIGQYLLVDGSGDERIVNVFNDTMLIKTLGHLNEEWVFYKYSNGATVKARVIHVDITNVVGVMDSVKHIQITYFDSTGAAAYKPFNGFSFIISKNYGWVKKTVFNAFPVNENEIILSADSLVGLSNPNRGLFINLSDAVYKYEIGDEWHYNQYYDTYKALCIRKVIGKVEHSDSVMYIFRTAVRSRTQFDSSKVDTLVIKSIQNSIIKPYDARYSYLGNTTLIKLTYPCVYFDKSDSCASVTSDACNTVAYYLTGVGYFSQYSSMGGATTSGKILQYVKKGGTIWGTPFALDWKEFAEGRRYRLVNYPGNKSLFYMYPANRRRVAEISSTLTKPSSTTHRFVFYPSKKEGCTDVSLQHSSWLGTQITDTDTGWSIVYNYKNEPIYFKTTAYLNEKWVAYRWKDSSYVEARVQSIDFDDVQDYYLYMDSVKRIYFSCYDKNHQPITHYLNSVYISLTRNSGLITTPEFNYFPFYNSTPQLYSREKYTTSNFNIEDDPFDTYLHKRVDILEVNNVHNTIIRTIRKQKNNRLSLDSWTYSYEDCARKDSAGVIAGIQKNLLTDTIKETDYSFLPMYVQPGGVVKDIHYPLGRFNSSEKTVTTVFYKTLPDGCSEELKSDSILIEHFHDGFGRYYTLMNSQGDTLAYSLPVYKETISAQPWGTPWADSCEALLTKDFSTQVYEPLRKDKFTIYPNPTTSKVHVKSIGEARIHFMDVSGRVMLTAALMHGENEIPLTELNAGIYLYVITQGSEFINSGKLVLLR